MHIIKRKQILEGVKVSNLIEYYVQGHTGKGYVNYINSNLQQIDRIILLKNRNPFIITNILKRIKKEFAEQQIEVIKSIDSTNIIEGIIIRELSLAVLNERIYKEKDEKVTIMKVAIQSDYVPKYDLENIKANQEKAHQHFVKGLSIHEKLEKIYISEMNFSKADKVINNLLTEIFSQVKKENKESIIYERLFGTNTPDGIVNTVPSLIKPIQKKVFILGRAGTGKSYLMNKILEKCIELGKDVELYRCSLDPNSIDMLIIRQLGVCLHDNTSPHVVSTEYNNKKIIDMYKETVNQSAEIKNEAKIEELKKRYKKEMKTGLHYLQQYKVQHLNCPIKDDEIIVYQLIKKMKNIE